MASIWARAVGHPVAFWLRCLWAFAMMTQCCAGRGQIRLWVLAAVLPPCLLMLIEPQFRHRQWNIVRSLWTNSTISESRTWAFTALFVGIPSFVLYISAAYAVINSGDTWPVVPTSISLVTRCTLDVQDHVSFAPPEYLVDHPEFEGLPYCVKRSGSGIYSRYPVGMTIFAIPVVTVGLLGGMDCNNSDAIATVDRMTACLVAVFVLTMFTRVAMLLSSPQSALLAAWMLAVGSAVYTTVAQTCWQHGGVAIGVLMVLLAELHPRLRSSFWCWILVTCGISLMYACRLSSGAMAAALMIWYFSGGWRRGLGFLISSVVGVLPVALCYWLIYFTPLGPAQAQLGSESWADSWMNGLTGVLLSPARGLLWYQPWVIVALIGLLWSFRQRWALLVLCCSGVHIGLVAYWSCWWGGSCWGSRLLTESMPLLALGLLPVINWCHKSRWGLCAYASLLLISAVPHFTGVYYFRVSENWVQTSESSLWNSPAWHQLFR